MIKKFYCFVMVTLIAVLLTACTSAVPSSTATDAPSTKIPPTKALATVKPTVSKDSESINKVCLVPGIGSINDGTFNQYAYEGMQTIVTDYKITSNYFISASASDFGPNIKKCLESGAQVIITVGFDTVEETTKAAIANPKLFFIGVDHFVANGPKNYVGIQFREDEVAFLVGYMAGLVTKSKVVAGVYGKPFPPLVKFRHGYEQGVALAAKKLGKPIKVLGVYLDSFSDPKAGAAAAKQFINEGADVIFGAAGFSGTGAILFAAEQAVYVIGVDQDEYYTSFKSGKMVGAKYIISSAMKHVNVGVYDMLSVLVEGNIKDFPGGSNYILSVENNGISFANRHESDIPNEVYDQVAEIETALDQGTISTGVDPMTGELLAK